MKVGIGKEKCVCIMNTIKIQKLIKENRKTLFPTLTQRKISSFFLCFIIYSKSSYLCLNFNYFLNKSTICSFLFWLCWIFFLLDVEEVQAFFLPSLSQKTSLSFFLFCSSVFNYRFYYLFLVLERIGQILKRFLLFAYTTL